MTTPASPPASSRRPRPPRRGGGAPPGGRLHVLARVLAAIVGTYALAWGFGALGAVAGTWLGMAPAEATTLFALLALSAMPGIALWALAAGRVMRVWAVLALGALVQIALAYLVRGAGA
ncbi:hypothetical protein FBZ89_13313 [Nitrospirillum amazonense]|uniref:Iron uptake protein n=1 Tax=Nitrospirillum amazonense TaxID=28077 RepID=A0A560EMZ5_9PROT|nr:hypothetical protein [Nitrospirillum amazonense]TWB10720.1 hypothetical protein FBZ89_13313 [Nitrospirillum amazonense]